MTTTTPSANSPIRCPSSRVEKIMSNGVRNACKRFGQFASDGEQTAAEWLLRHADDKRHDGALAMSAIRAGRDATIRKICIDLTYAPIELNQPIKSDGDGVIDVGELIASGDPLPEEVAEQHDLAAQIEDATAELTPLQQRIVKLLALGYSKTEIAKKVGVSKQLVNFHLVKHIRVVFAAHDLGDLSNDKRAARPVIKSSPLYKQLSNKDSLGRPIHAVIRRR